MNQSKKTAELTPDMLLEHYAETKLPTEFGTFRTIVFRESQAEIEHLALVVGDVTEAEGVVARVHSECFTGEVLHSFKCDCREQLHAGLAAISEAGCGILIYLRQEGRGIGLGNKIRAYALQEEGHDTVEANRLLGFGDDQRTYEVAAHILRYLKVRSIRLLTNNPLKIRSLQELGVTVDERLPLICPTNPHSLSYFRTKQQRMGHMFDPTALEDE